METLDAFVDKLFGRMQGCMLTLAFVILLVMGACLAVGVLAGYTITW